MMEYLEVDHLSIKVLKRVFAKVSIDADTSCWNWKGALDPDYGLVWYKGRHEKIHRLMYAWLVDKLPRGHVRRFAQLDHLCRNIQCCNPVHLELVTGRVNVLRGTSPPAVNAKKTLCHKGHPFSLAPRGVRYCRTCDLEKHKTRLLGPNGKKYREISRLAAARYRARLKETIVNG